MLPNKTNILSYFIRDLKDQDTFNQSNKLVVFQYIINMKDLILYFIFKIFVYKLLNILKIRLKIFIECLIIIDCLYYVCLVFKKI